MYVYMYMYMYMYMYVYVCVYALCVNVCVNAYVHVNVYVSYMCIMYVYMSCLLMHIYAYLCIYMKLKLYSTTPLQTDTNHTSNYIVNSMLQSSSNQFKQSADPSTCLQR